MTIDVVVPVYRGAPMARRCIESILEYQQQTPFEIVVVSDASPEPELVRWLREAAERGRITLIEQPVHQGFAGAVNRAAGLHTDRNLVIVHSDAELANDWLDRLAGHAASQRDIGTVSPFSNYGGVAGYPLSGSKNALPDGYTSGTLDLLFRRANRGASVAVPLSCGPCVYVRRPCLDAVGPFDSGPLGSDYGVEQDFCLRASSTGFRHLLAADVYIWHHGAASFGAAEAMELSTRAEQAICKLYPHYRSQRAEFAERDPARPYQRRVDLLRLAESPRQLLLFVAHAWGGGIRRHMNELAAMISDRCDVMFLEPVSGDRVKLSWPMAGEGFVLYYSLPQDSRELVSSLRELRLARMHFHHVHGLPRAVLDLPGAIGVPYDCTLHDYYPICPQYHLVTEDGRYCGEPDTVGCTACLTRRPGQWGLDIVAWRGAFGTLLRGADRVFAPSRDVAQRVARYFPDLRVTVMPHPESTLETIRRVTRVVTLGNLSPDKGLDVVAACAADASGRNLPLSFRVLGPTTRPLPQQPGIVFSTHGEYAEADLPLLIAAERPDVIWFPAQVPETYSYTLSVALASGAAIVASALGAFPERLAGHPRARLVPWNATPGEWNDVLLESAEAIPASRTLRSRVVTT